MRRRLLSSVLLACAAGLLPGLASAQVPNSNVAQMGPRPFFLVNDMRDGPLKQQLQACTTRPIFVAKDFAIGHRGAAMQFPEHTNFNAIQPDSCRTTGMQCRMCRSLKAK